jgi:hypothetical protein
MLLRKLFFCSVTWLSGQYWGARGSEADAEPVCEEERI